MKNEWNINFLQNSSLSIQQNSVIFSLMEETLEIILEVVLLNQILPLRWMLHLENKKYLLIKYGGYYTNIILCFNQKISLKMYQDKLHFFTLALTHLDISPAVPLKFKASVLLVFHHNSYSFKIKPKKRLQNVL